MPTTLKSVNCIQCTAGLVPGDTKTFDPRCRGCQKKLATGLRTGKEPPPVVGGNRGHRRKSAAAFATYMARVRAGRARVERIKLQSGT